MRKPESVFLRQDQCDATIYIGSYYDNELPKGFLEDFQVTTKPILWMGYSIWQLGNVFEETFGYKFSSIAGLEYSAITSVSEMLGTKPTFYRDVHYKGEVFSKYESWGVGTSDIFIGAPEINILKPTAPERSDVLASIFHTNGISKTPWALRSNNYFYIAEVPLSFIHESDRYLVLADILFDFLNEKPRSEQHLAVVRLEDIHPAIDIESFKLSIDILKKYKIKPTLTLIPFFRDPFRLSYVPEGEPLEGSMNDYKDFLKEVRKISDQGATIIWHGVTHATDGIANPFTGITGDDYEFWDSLNNKPLEKDSGAFAIQRLQLGQKEFLTANIQSQIWVTPHYRASAVDNLVFSKFFPWSMGRSSYIPLQFSAFSLDLNSLAQLTDQNIISSPTKNQFIGQFVPYEIYGDYNQQRLLPENLGNIQPYLSDQVVKTRSVEDLIADAKRNLVIRDSWASFFYHPFLLNVEDATNNSLVTLITELKSLGYQFIDLNQWTSQHISVPKVKRVQLESGR